jgi:hypothetical protein
MIAVEPLPKRAISDCINQLVKCPDCGATAKVDNARGARTATQVISSRWWMLIRCKGACGAKLVKVSTLVEPLEDPTPPVITKPLGQAVGQFVRCPRPGCSMKSMAAWDMDNGHIIKCPACQARQYDPATEVELCSQ